ncbi:MAG: site-2 protease family protein [Phycisphaerales bacterium]
MSDRDWQSSYPHGQDRLAKARAIMARIFGDGENPLAWGFTIFTVRGTRVRLHLLFIVYLLAQLIFTLPGNRAGFIFVMPTLVAMLVLVLLHELAHAAVCRRVGGEAPELMLWPLGGLAPLDVPDEPAARIKVALAGPALNLLLIPVLGVPLVMLTGSAVAFLHSPITADLAPLTLRSGETTWWLVALGAFYSVNLLLVVMNLLLPMYPLDAARVLEAILSKDRSSYRAMWLATNTGLGVATAVGFAGILFEDGVWLLTIAIVCGLVCSIQRRRLQFLAHADMVPGMGGSFPGMPDPEAWRGGPPRQRVVDDHDEEIISREELDRILAKISAKGMGSLSRRERRTLKRASETSRKPR